MKHITILWLSYFAYWIILFFSFSLSESLGDKWMLASVVYVQVALLFWIGNKKYSLSITCIGIIIFMPVIFVLVTVKIYYFMRFEYLVLSPLADKIYYDSVIDGVYIPLYAICNFLFVGGGFFLRRVFDER